MPELGWSKSDALVSRGRWGMKMAMRVMRVSASQESGKERLFIRDRRQQELDAGRREEAKLGGEPSISRVSFLILFSRQKPKDTISAPIIQTQTHFFLHMVVPL